MISGKYGDELLVANAPSVISGILLVGYGIWKMIIAKGHIHQLTLKLDSAKDELTKATGGYHHQRPGDDLIRKALDSFL